MVDSKSQKATGADQVTKRIRKPRVPIDPDETKAQRFKRVGNRRLTNALRTISHVARLGNTLNYEYTPDQANKVLITLQEAVNRVKYAFSGQVAQTNGNLL